MSWNRGNRGQTNLDFIIGLTLFLFAFTFIIGFIPQLATPYENQETPLVSERVSTTVADSLLTTGTEMGVLNTTCTGTFFTDLEAPDCPNRTGSLADRVGISNTYRVNVTLRWNVSGDRTPEVLCFNSGDVGRCGTDRLAAGRPTPSTHRSVAVTRRTVVVAGQPAILEVSVWQHD